MKNSLPLTTSVLAMFATLLATSPTLSAALQWDAGVGLSEPWRVLTSHLTHWSWNHLSWDLLAFVVLGGMCERVARRRYQWTLLLSAVAIPLVVTALHPDITTYRGLSGVDSALFALLACEFARAGIKERNRLLTVVAIAGWVLFVGKICFELLTGGLVFVSDTSFVPVPMSHIAGAVVGTLAAITPPFRGDAFRKFRANDNAELRTPVPVASALESDSA